MTEELTELSDVQLVSADELVLGPVLGTYIAASVGEALALACALEGHEDVAVVPLEGAEVEGGRIYVQFDAEAVETSPPVEPEQDLSLREARQVFAHYQLDEVVPELLVRMEEEGETPGDGPLLIFAPAEDASEED